MQDPAFAIALQRESHARAQAMIEGVKDYQTQSISREETPHRVIWRKANAKLLDYGGDLNAPALLCVPSLINRYTILDLYPQRSLVRFLRDAGIRVCVLDWGTPGPRERQYDMSGYVDYLLLDALDQLRFIHKGPLHLLGYCMGGMLALAAAQLRPQAIDGLALLATPWARPFAPPLSARDWSRFKDHLRTQKEVPPLITQTFFHLLDPWRFQEKFGRYSALNPNEKKHFAEVEHWVNDGVPLSRHVAEECYLKWPREDYFANGKWRVRGETIDPEKMDSPVFLSMPTKDKIVPLESSEPLAALLPHAETLKPESGHISMLVGKHAKQQLWEPLLEWLQAS